MKNIRLALEVFLVSMFLTAMMGCATARTKHSDPTMRIAVVADETSYFEIQTALVETGKYFVVDRAHGFQAAVEEQEFNATERVGDKERYARIGKMFGVGGVVVGQVSCTPHGSFFAGLSSPSADCVEHLSLISTSTGEVVASARAKVNTAYDRGHSRVFPPSWEEAVQNLNDNMPSHFVKAKWTEKMQDFRDGKIDDVNGEGL